MSDHDAQAPPKNIPANHISTSIALPTVDQIYANEMACGPKPSRINLE
jgi:hypothetical protein